MIKETININKLSLDTNNPRFKNTPDSQRDAIREMVELQGDKLLALAKDILEFGLDPSANIIAIKDEENNLIVAEGNRRVTTLKLLHNPDIITENSTTRKIKSLIATNPDIPKQVDCVIYEIGDDTYEHWVSLIHTGENAGAGRVRWTGQEKDNYDARHGNGSFQHQLLEFIKKEPTVAKNVQENSSKISITNLSRLVGDPHVRECLGVNPPSQGLLYCHITKEQFVVKVNLVAEAMLETDEKGKLEFTVNRIRHKKDRSDFMEQLGLHPVEKTLDKPWKVIDPNSYVPSSTTTEQSKPTPNSANQESEKESKPAPSSQTPTQEEQQTKPSVESENPNGSKPSNDSNQTLKSQNLNPNRNILVPANVKLTIPNKKINGIFKELKNKLAFDTQPYSISVMFRIFIELSVMNYIEKHQIMIPEKKNGLADKVNFVSEHLRTSNKISNTEDKAIKAVSGTNFKSNGAIQQYIHNPSMHPDKPALNTLWSNLEPLFKGIWS